MKWNLLYNNKYIIYQISKKLNTENDAIDLKYIKRIDTQTLQHTHTFNHNEYDAQIFFNLQEIRDLVNRLNQIPVKAFYYEYFKYGIIDLKRKLYL